MVNLALWSDERLARMFAIDWALTLNTNRADHLFDWNHFTTTCLKWNQVHWCQKCAVSWVLFFAFAGLWRGFVLLSIISRLIYCIALLKMPIIAQLIVTACNCFFQLLLNTDCSSSIFQLIHSNLSDRIAILAHLLNFTR